MRVHRSITEPIRPDGTWEERWAAKDQGLIACWERGREIGAQDPELAAKAQKGELPILAWKGGVTKALKAKQKFGTLSYLATWQGLRGEDLDVDISREIALTCSATGMTVVFTNDFNKFANQ